MQFAIIGENRGVGKKQGHSLSASDGNFVMAIIATASYLFLSKNARKIALFVSLCMNHSFDLYTRREQQTQPF